MTSTVSSTMANYPFSALVGHDRLRLALILCAVRPDIGGGVLIRGEKAPPNRPRSAAWRPCCPRSTTRRGWWSCRSVPPRTGWSDHWICNGCCVTVSRPSNRVCWPGPTAGVLYVDEVNLLHDHLVDVLLDAAAMGRVHIERDGISHSHDARFVLVGTMNPEEGGSCARSCWTGSGSPSMWPPHVMSMCASR